MSKNGRVKLRKKLKEHRRERKKKIFKGLGKLTLFLCLIAGLALAGKKVEDFLLNSPFFEIKEINFKGATCLGREVLENSANIELGENIFQINLKRIQERLERHPRVREAAVSRGFPNAVTVDIREREAVALLESAGKIYPVDEEGIILPPAKTDGSTLPVIKGVKVRKLKVGEKLQWPKLTPLLDVLETLTSSDLKISEIDLRPEGAVLRYKGTKVLLGELNKTQPKGCDYQVAAGFNLRTNKERRVEELKLILSDLAGRKEEAEYIDLRFARPVVRLTRKSAAQP